MIKRHWPPPNPKKEELPIILNLFTSEFFYVLCIKLFLLGQFFFTFRIGYGIFLKAASGKKPGLDPHRFVSLS